MRGSTYILAEDTIIRECYAKGYSNLQIRECLAEKGYKRSISSVRNHVSTLLETKKMYRDFNQLIRKNQFMV